ncbi:MAG: hypothetical protein V2A65_04800 [Candidatus Omnitrophota bacterium]
MKKYEKWLWIELIGFDNRKSDFGVKKYLDNAGFVPGLLSLLVSSADFVHLHDTAAGDESFPPDFCSYGGRLPCGEGKKRQSWTKCELKKFIAEFHKYGIKVYFAVFDIFLNNMFHDEWAGKHREILATTRTGEKINSINPLTRLKDGTYYEDFFARKLIEVIRDYGFDGFHCADGCNHLRMPLYWSDYSDDMVDQFTESAGIKLPKDISGKSDGNKPRSEKRADWIWRNRRVEWITFFVQRWEEHCGKIVNAVHNEGKQVLFNTSWTRDPFEAIYRYGIDYRKIADTGVDYFIQECPGAGNEIGAEGLVYPDFFYKIMATILLTKASIPDAKITALNHIHDVNENWEVLRHAPTLLEKEIYTYPNLFHLDAQNNLKRCIEGFLVCLADGINHEEWQWLKYNWTRSFETIPEFIAGPTLVWSDKALENQLADFVKTRCAPTHNILYRLLAKGAPIYTVVNIDNIDKVRGPVLVINHHCFPEEELKKILAYKNGPVVMIGKKKKFSSDPDFQFKDVYLLEIVSESKEEIPDDIPGVEEPPIYCLDLYSRKISESFLTRCAEILSQLVDGVKVLNNVPVKILMMTHGKDVIRLFIRNDEFGYVHPEIDLEKKIRRIRTITKFPYKPVAFNGSKFIVRVPGKGVVVLDIWVW